MTPTPPPDSSGMSHSASWLATRGLPRPAERCANGWGVPGVPVWGEVPTGPVPGALGARTRWVTPGIRGLAVRR